MAATEGSVLEKEVVEESSSKGPYCHYFPPEQRKLYYQRKIKTMVAICGYLPKSGGRMTPANGDKPHCPECFRLLMEGML